MMSVRHLRAAGGTAAAAFFLLAAAPMWSPAMAQADAQRRTESTIGYPTVDAAYRALSGKPGVRISTSNGWTRISDPATRTIWSFVAEIHDAYPSVIKQQIKQRGNEVTVSLDALCQAEKPDCDAFWTAAVTQNEKFKTRLRRQVAAQASRITPAAEKRTAATETLTAFLQAYDAGEFDKAYAMLAPSAKQRISADQYREFGIQARERLSGAPYRQPPRESWYRDLPDAPVKGTIAAFDIQCSYVNMAVCKERLLLHEQPDGSFLVLRHDQSMIDRETMQDMIDKRDKGGR